MTVAIAFSGGTYGTYLEWCLDTLTTEKEISPPFNTNGNSHNYPGTHLLNMAGWNEFVQGSNQPNFARLHPKTSKNESLTKNLEQLCRESEFVIHLYPSENTKLLCINNLFTKVWEDWWTQEFESTSDTGMIYQNWPIEPGTPLKDVPVWIKREFLSFYMVPSWNDMVEWYHPSVWSHPKCLTVTVEELLYNFEFTLDKITTVLNLDTKKEIQQLLPYHKQNLQLQKFLHHDQLCANIVQSMYSNTDWSWEPLGLFGESWVQWELRNQGFEIQCHDLDIFPTNSLQLKKLLYLS